MNHKSPSHPTIHRLLAASLCALTLGGCSLPQAKVQPTPPLASPSISVTDTDRRVVVDGDISEWPYATVALADNRFVYVRFSLGPPRQALQASDETVLVLLDLDGSTLSGHTNETWPGAAGLGIDLEIQLSPMDPHRGSPRAGVSLATIDRRGRRTPISHADAGFVFAPTHSSEWFELRVSRNIPGLERIERDEPSLAVAPVHVELDPPTPLSRELAPIRGAGVVVLVDAAGEQNGSLNPFGFDLPELEQGVRRATMPRKATDSIRVMSYNVLRSSPAKNPAPFARLISAIDPDVILFQEWGADAETIEAWFQQNLGESWNVASHANQGVSIAARGQVTDLLDGSITVADRRRPVRAILARVHTPLRDTIITSVHLKCCGGAGSDEDITRIQEAKAINDAIARHAPQGNKLRLIAGDLNLVGSRLPLDALRAQIDTDRTDLEIAPTYLLGDASASSWRDASSPFSPGRLDYLAYSDAQASVVNAFIVDTALFSDAALESAGLLAGDSLASDHLPIVVDLRLHPEPAEVLGWPLERDQ